MNEYYDIHGLVSIEVRRPTAFDLLPEFSQPFRYFQIPRLERVPDIVLEIGNFEPDNRGCYLVDHRFHVRENYFYSEDNYRAARWRIEIKGFEAGPAHVRLSGTYRNIRQVLAPGMFWESLLLKQLVAFHLSKQGYYLVHGAAASRRGRGVILFGRGGAYKTTLLMTLLRSEADWRMMGDDTVIVGNGQIFSCPTLAGFFAFRYKYLPTERLTRLDKLRLVSFLARFNPKELPMIVDKSELAGIVQCHLGNSEKTTLSHEDNIQSISRLIRVSAAEDFTTWNTGHIGVYSRYVEAYSYVFPNNTIIKRWQNASASLTANSDNTASLALRLPQPPGTLDFVEAVQTLSNILETRS